MGIERAQDLTQQGGATNWRVQLDTPSAMTRLKELEIVSQASDLYLRNEALSLEVSMPGAVSG